MDHLTDGRKSTRSHESVRLFQKPYLRKQQFLSNKQTAFFIGVHETILKTRATGRYISTSIAAIYILFLLYFLFFTLLQIPTFPSPLRTFCLPQISAPFPLAITTLLSVPVGYAYMLFD